MIHLAVPEKLHPDERTKEIISEFIQKLKPFEISLGAKLVLYFDQKSRAYYTLCHLPAKTLSNSCDLEASLDGNEDDEEIYKLNRNITEDKVAYKIMENDAKNGRSFEDLVIEYDENYKPARPLKVYGGQHRLQAIKKSVSSQPEVLHGVRIYFNLSKDQKVEIATVNNTSIAVPNDLLDRMQEQLLGPELRDWCQKVGLLEDGQDFADKKDPVAPTVVVARTLIINFFRGLNAGKENFHQPLVCKSGGRDENYDKLRSSVDWSDAKLIQMGECFAELHRVQRLTVNERKKDSYAEYARKALSMAVVASRVYASGLLQGDSGALESLYSLPKRVSTPNDPLNAKALSEARHKGIDPDTYRGLGTRNNSNELGRMLEVFIVLATQSTRKVITKDLANAAIKSYEAKKATHEANKALGKI
jgi:hypothetical protein